VRRRLRATDVLAEIFNDSDSAESVDDSDIVMWSCMTAVKNPRRDSVVCKSHRGQGIEKRWIKGESRKQSTCVAVVMANQHCASLLASSFITLGQTTELDCSSMNSVFGDNGS